MILGRPPLPGAGLSISSQFSSIATTPASSIRLAIRRTVLWLIIVSNLARLSTSCSVKSPNSSSSSCGAVAVRVRGAFLEGTPPIGAALQLGEWNLPAATIM
jgi:hypothetical protein